MALTPGDICNVALSKLGETKFIDSLTANTNNARVANLLYEPSRDALLEMVPWPFAERNVVLGELFNATDDSTNVLLANSGWGYVYALPTDCLCPRYIETGLPNPAEDQKIPFKLRDSASNGVVLLTNEEDAELVYTRKVTETGKFSPLFVEALAWKLAYEFTFAIPVKPGVAERMMAGFNQRLLEAAAASQKHEQQSPKPRPGAIRARS